MRSATAYHVVGLLWCCVASSATAQQVKVMHWNVHGNIGTSTANSSPGAAAIARILNYVQPDVLLIKEVDDGSWWGKLSNWPALLPSAAASVDDAGMSAL